jgi:hypothetical protein
MLGTSGSADPGYGSRSECPVLILHPKSPPPVAESPCAAESSLHGLGTSGVSSVNACSKALRQKCFLLMNGAMAVLGLYQRYGSRRECPVLILHPRSPPHAAESLCAAELLSHGLEILGVSSVNACSRAL